MACIFEAELLRFHAHAQGPADAQARKDLIGMHANLCSQFWSRALQTPLRALAPAHVQQHKRSA
eukprot:scaffold295854_cov15-Tisochrysis_lutea.AAC.1